MRSGSITATSSGVRIVGKAQRGYIPPGRAQKWAELLRNPCLGGPQKRGPKQKYLHHPCLPISPQEGGIAT